MWDAHEHFLLGEGTRSPVYLSREARRRHLAVFGKTGMGKSTFLTNLAIHDMRASHKRLLPLGTQVNIYHNGLCFIDPHGDSARFLTTHVPQDRTNDTFYFDVTDRNFCPGFNLFSDLPAACNGAAAAAVVSLFSHMFSLSQQDTPRILHYLRFSLLALMECKDVTLAHLPYMLGTTKKNELFRAWVLRHVRNQEVLEFWHDEYANHATKYNDEAAAPILSRVKALLAYPVVANIVGQNKSTFDIRKAMDERMIIIVNLAEGHIGEEATNLLGSLFMTKIHLAAMSRIDIEDEEDRPDFPVIVDEIKKFTTSSFENILSEARKMRVNLTVASQFRSQLIDPIRDAIEGNVGALLSFQVGVDDAEHFRKSFGLGSDEALIDLPPFKAYFRSIDHPGGTRLDCLPNLKPNRPGGNDVINASRRTFMVPRRKAQAEYKAIKRMDFLNQ